MPDTETLLKGLAWFIPALIFLVLISLRLFDEDNKVDLGSLKKIIWETRGGAFILLLIALAVKVENFVKDQTHFVGFEATSLFYQIEGVEHVVFLQNHLGKWLIINSASLFYILGLTYFVVFIPLFYLARGEKENFLFFSKGLAVNYMFILPGYFLLHVTVTSYQAGAVEPVMYSNEQYLAILKLINRLSNCFPSGHVSISLTITLIALFKAKLKRLGIFGIIFTVLTGFVIIFLGVHWLLDIVAGVIVGVVSYHLVSEGKLDFIFDPIMNFFERKTEHLFS
ncbi:MAG: phosphatase PAP2 family protein [Candidatus Thermoplasmatota archaeon]|nr:phosphatase PAP2 family protein [Candidatus Thermoplasmatota archaeon]